MRNLLFAILLFVSLSSPAYSLDGWYPAREWFKTLTGAKYEFFYIYIDSATLEYINSNIGHPKKSATQHLK